MRVHCQELRNLLHNQKVSWFTFLYLRMFQKVKLKIFSYQTIDMSTKSAVLNCYGKTDLNRQAPGWLRVMPGERRAAWRVNQCSAMHRPSNLKRTAARWRYIPMTQASLQRHPLYKGRFTRQTLIRPFCSWADRSGLSGRLDLQWFWTFGFAWTFSGSEPSGSRGP